MTRLTHSFSSIKMFENCPHRYYHQRVAKTVVDKGGEASLHGERIHKFLEDRLKGVTMELPPEIQQIEPTVQTIQKLVGNGQLHVELELTLNESLTPTGWWDADAWLRSKLDILVIKGSDAYCLDWKTGKRRPDFSQLELFAAQVFAHYPEVETVTSSFIWLKDTALDKETYKRQHLSRLWENVLSRIKRIEQSAETNNWPAKPSGLCNYCPCKHFCEYAN